MSVLGDGNQAIVDALTEVGALLKVEDYGHKYPYDWRTKKPTIFRATDQWFASVEGFRDGALEAVEQVSVGLLTINTCSFADEEYFNPEGLNAVFCCLMRQLKPSFLTRTQIDFRADLLRILSFGGCD